MSPTLSFILSLLVPILPWIALSSWWVVKAGSVPSLWLLLGFGLFLDIWWVRPLGSTSLILALLVVILHLGAKSWPASYKSFGPVALIVGMIVFEAYLILL